MAIFEYQALTSAGRLIKGELEADSRNEASLMLQEMALIVNSLEKARKAVPKTPIGRSEFILFNEQLAAIAKAGIPLERSLRALSRDVASKRMQRLIDSIADDLEAGASIEEAFEKRKKYFPPLYGRIIKAGVSTGQLGQMLTSLNRHLEVAGRTRRIIFEAICYPAVVLALAAVILTVMLVFVVPQFGFVMYENYAPMPPMTRLLMKAADNVGFIWAGIAAAAVAFVLLRVLLGVFPRGRRFKDSLVLSLPVIGRIYHASMLGRMADAMATLVAAECSLPSCLRLAADAAGSETMKFQCESLAGRVERGDDILDASADCTILPQLFLYSVKLGLRRNDLEDNLYSLADMYTRQAQTNQGRLQALLLPVLLIFTGAIIAFGVMALFFPLIRSMTSMI